MNDLDQELKDAYEEGYRVGYLSLPPCSGYSVLSDLHAEWQRGREKGAKDREKRIKGTAAARAVAGGEK